MSAVVVREAIEDDVPHIEALMLAGFGVVRAPGTWRWLFRETPGGAGRSVVAVAAGRVVAHAGTVTRPLVDGRPIRAAQSVDMVTAPLWRGQGLQRRLWGLLCELHVRDRVELVYGFSNERSTPHVLRRGRTPLGAVPLVARPLAPPCGPPRLPPAPLAAPPSLPVGSPPSLGALSPLGGGAVGGAWDAATLAWRYARPGGERFAHVVRDGLGVAAWGACGIMRRRGLRVALLMHRLAGTEEALAHLDRALLAEARRRGCRVALALAWPGTPDRERLRARGFVAVPDRLSPERLVFGVHVSAGAPYRLLAPAGWRLSWADHDLP